ncbi:hypothetical protein SAMN02745857_00232 [Andreprevotia lacus DSM 23236]|uniref:Uncharacterized protein n=1 Tax=Andreprevotia lacus DSM 23236 TaxID=1121001 RepID=A0A1W1WY47_9NEIS|nr:hypothetical protein SAMN02745857_00232 [Andreprevotia lacus DSM 23236]
MGHRLTTALNWPPQTCPTPFMLIVFVLLWDLLKRLTTRTAAPRFYGRRIAPAKCPAHYRRKPAWVKRELICIQARTG